MVPPSDRAYPIALNFVPVATGGGLQNALSFLIEASSKPEFISRCLILCRRSSVIAREAKARGLHTIEFNDSMAGRLAYEMGGAKAVFARHGVKVCFTVYGNPPIIKGKTRMISGFAFSNILCPHIDFWRDFTPFQKKMKAVKDWLRLSLARRADCIVLETEYLKAQAKKLGAFPNSRLAVVTTELSGVVGTERCQERQRNGAEDIVILALAGAQRNKRIHRMGPIIAQLNAITNGDRTYKLRTTMPEDQPYFEMVRDSFADAGALDCLDNIGPVLPQDVGRTIDKVDALVNIARLESFSNNWVEAWGSDKPLISTDADWARANIGDAAIFVDPEDPEQAARAIDSYFSAPSEALIEAGRRQRAKLASGGTRADKYIAVIEQTLERAA